MSFAVTSSADKATRHEKAVGVAIMANRNVTPAVEQAMVGKNAVGGDQIVDELRVGRAGRNGTGCARPMLAMHVAASANRIALRCAARAA